VGLGASVLYGKQDMHALGEVRSDYISMGIQRLYLEGPTTEPVAVNRSRSVIVPSLNANLGLSYTLGVLKLSGGYRVERYFDAIDGGIETRETYDRQYDGPYFKVSIGFGG